MKEILKSKIMILFILLVFGVTYVNSEQIKMENNIQDENLIILNA